jgi:hypothetical protein
MATTLVAPTTQKEEFKMELKVKEVQQGSAKVGFGMFHPAIRTLYETTEDGKDYQRIEVTCGCRGTKGGHDPRSGGWRFSIGKLPECKNSKKDRGSN